MQVQTFHEKLIKTWKRPFWLNNIVPDAVFLIAFKMQESYICSMKIYKIYHNMGHPDKTLAEVFEANDGNLYIILVRTIRVNPYCP